MVHVEYKLCTKEVWAQLCQHMDHSIGLLDCGPVQLSSSQLLGDILDTAFHSLLIFLDEYGSNSIVAGICVQLIGLAAIRVSHHSAGNQEFLQYLKCVLLFWSLCAQEYNIRRLCWCDEGCAFGIATLLYIDKAHVE